MLRTRQRLRHIPGGGGYDIFISAGQSNEFYGTGYDNNLDNLNLDLSLIYQQPTGYPGGAVPALSAAGARDPLTYTADNSNQSPGNTYIGHAVHFLADAVTGYNAKYLKAPRKVVIVPAAKGGSPVGSNTFSGWGVFSATTGGLSSDMVAATNAAIALPGGTNTLKGMLWTQGEGDYQAFGTTPNMTACYKYRAQLISVFEYFRATYPGMPIMLSRLSTYSIDAGGTVYSYNGRIIDAIIQSIPGVYNYCGLVDSQSPVALGASAIHFNAAEQRTLATRFQAAYDVALAATTTPVTWDPFFIPNASWGNSAGFTLSNGNLDLSGTAAAAWKTAVATGPRRGGKLHIEFTYTAVANANDAGMVGFCNPYVQIDTSNANYLGNNLSQGTFYGGIPGKAAGVWGNNGSLCTGFTHTTPATLTATAVNDRITMEVDFTAGKAWVKKNGGAWAGGGDPVAGTNPWISGIDNGSPLFAAASIYTNAGNTVRINGGASAFVDTPSTGYIAWKDGTP